MANSEVVLSLKETTLSIQEKELFSNLNLQVCSEKSYWFVEEVVLEKAA